MNTAQAAQALFQSEQHPLVPDVCATVEDHCLALIHRKAYATAASLARGLDVLDVGCNHGYGTRVISEGARSIVGVDVSPTSIAEARRRHPHLRFEQVDGSTLPFEDASFDLVTSFQVIEHVADVPPFLSEIDRVLRPGGRAVLTTPNGLLRLTPGMRPWNPFHVREYSPDELRRTVQEVFPSVEVRGLEGPKAFERIERARVMRARRMAEWRRVGGPAFRAAAMLQGRVNRLRKRAALRVMESSLAPWVETMRGRWRLEELGWRDTNVDDALDLLVIARKAGRDTT